MAKKNKYMDISDDEFRRLIQERLDEHRRQALRLASAAKDPAYKHRKVWRRGYTVKEHKVRGHWMLPGYHPKKKGS